MDYIEDGIDPAFVGRLLLDLDFCRMQAKYGGVGMSTRHSNNNHNNNSNTDNAGETNINIE